MAGLGSSEGIVLGDVERYFLSYDVRNVRLFESCNLKILFLNINRLANKIDKLEFFIRCLNVEFDVLVLCETWATIDSVQFLNIRGFNGFHYIRNGNGGGLSIFVRESMAAEVIGTNFLNAHINDENTEFFIVSLTGLKIKICATYRRPINNYDEYLRKLDRVLSKYRNSIIAGDNNINILLNSPQTILFNNILTSNGYKLFNNCDTSLHTRKSHHGTVTTIDHFYSDLSPSQIKLAIGDNDSLSDHRYLLLGLAFHNVNNEFIVRYVTKTNYDAISESLDSLSDFPFDVFHNKLMELFNLHTTSIKISSKPDSHNDWFSSQLLETKKVRDHFYKLSKKYPNTLFYKNRFKFYRNKLNFDIRLAKQNFYSNMFLTNIDNSSKTWQIFHEIMYNKKKNLSTTFPSLRSNTHLLSSPQEKANAFNDYFVRAGSDLNDSSRELIDSESSSHTDYPPLLTFEPTNSDEVLQIVNSLKNNTSSGYDKVSSSFIKKNAQFFSEYFSKQINELFSSGSFPDSLKVARVTPIHKAGSKQLPGNYRPISVLPCFSKIFESVIKKRLEDFISNNSLMHKNQFGFLKHSSTVAAATSMVNEIVTRVNSKLKTALLFLDIRRAFDSLNHDVLIRILRKWGVRGSALKLLENFLRNRFQFVFLENCSSANQRIISGIPQGSVLGPLLFLIYINDVLNLKLHSYIQLYADDAVLVLGASDFLELKRKMEEDLTSVSIWLSSVDLSLNLSKSKFMIVRRINTDQSNIFYNLNIGNQTVESCSEFEYLGLTLDQNLNWQAHLNKVCSQISPYAFVLRRVRHVLNQKALFKLYNAYVLSRITYLLPIWGGAPKCYLKNLQFLQNKIIKTILFLPSDTSTISLYSSKRLSIYQQFSYDSIFLVFKMVNGLLKTNFNFICNQLVTGRSTRSSSLLRLPNYTTVVAQRSTFYYGINLYNKLPSNVKYVRSVSGFKRELRLYVSDNLPVVL